MDAHKAKKLEQTLQGKGFLEYTIVKLLDNGKSAAVFQGEDKSGNKVAIKIFDNDLLERFGHEMEEKRIKQEISLKGHSIKNLVRIVDGGNTEVEGEKYYYIIMEFIDGENLKKFYKQNTTYSNDFIKKVFRVLYSVTEELLKKGLAHRDIKPENIMVDKQGDIIVMDLGVLKLIGGPSYSDINSKQFVATQQYAPPELLTREEKDSEDGWRAINLYQIGAVLHDLIMKKELFSDYEPYTNIVRAILNEIPVVSNPLYPFNTVQITRNLLSKDPNKRLNLCSPNAIELFLNQENDDSDLDNALNSFFTKTVDNKAKLDEIESLKRSNEERLNLRRKIALDINAHIDSCFQLLKEKKLFKRYSKSNPFTFRADLLSSHLFQNKIVTNTLYELEGEYEQGYIKKLYVLTRTINNEDGVGDISLASMFLSINTQYSVDSPKIIFKEIGKQRTSPAIGVHSNTGDTFKPEMYKCFEGVINLDEQFKKILSLEIFKIVQVALDAALPEVEKELDYQAKVQKGVIERQVLRTIETNFSTTRIFCKVN